VLPNERAVHVASVIPRVEISRSTTDMQVELPARLPPMPKIEPVAIQADNDKSQ